MLDKRGGRKAPEVCLKFNFAGWYNRPLGFSQCPINLYLSEQSTKLDPIPMCNSLPDDKPRITI